MTTPLEPWHRHDQGCYWDHARCGWVCPPAPPEVRVEEIVVDEVDIGPVPELASRTAL